LNPGSRSRFGLPPPGLAELKPLTDDQLMVQLQEGVNDALAVLFERYHRLVFSIALKIVRDRGEAEDVTQNVFLEIYSSVAQFDPGKADGRGLIRSAVEFKPDIIILDIYMPQLNGLDAAVQIKRKLPGVKLVFLTMTMATDVAAEAFRRGASAFVLKQSAGDELLLAVRKVKMAYRTSLPTCQRDGDVPSA
jgi:CheY-like chemotaxis protein